MIRVLYDHQGLDAAYGGVSQYFNSILTNLPDDIQPIVSLARTINPFLQQPPFNVKKTEMTLDDFREKWLKGYSPKGSGALFVLLGRLFPAIFPCGLNANISSFRQCIEKGEFDIYHLTKAHPIHDEAGIVCGRKPVIATIHDLIPDLEGDKAVIRGRRKTLAGVSHVIAVSENTKHDLQNLYNVPDEKITVIYHGYLSVPAEGDGRKWESLPELRDIPYIMFVGRREGYKNFEWFLREIAPLLKNRGMRLLCTGSGFSKLELKILKDLKIADSVVSRCLSNEELLRAYAHARAFVYPSRYEGFGMPILDAFSMGCPVVLYRGSCFPEVAHDAALYFDPGDGATLRSQIVRLCEDSALREAMIRRGFNRLAAFSWEKSAEAHAEVYRRLLRR